MSAEPEKVGDASDEVEDMEDEEESADIKAQILKRPELVSMLQARIAAAEAKNLPLPVKRRVKALKKIQVDTTHIEAKFYEEVHELECKYHQLYTPFYEKRSTIIQGLYEPTDPECDFPSDDEKDDELCNDIKSKVKIEDVTETKEPKNEEEKNQANASGIPDFWLTIFKNVDILSDMVQEHDEPILKHLIDVKVILLKADPMGFVLEFHFSPNEFFSNSVLTKVYEMKCVPEESDPFNFEGPEIYKCKGCIIDWKKGKNVTVKVVKKKQKHKSRGSIRMVPKTVQIDSFFNFFSPPVMPEDPDADVDEDTQSLLTSDFEIGHYIRERIVPRAVLYFTGEALDDEEDFEEEEEEGDEDEEDDEDAEDEDPDFDPRDPKLPKTKKNGGTPAECKQQ